MNILLYLQDFNAISKDITLGLRKNDFSFQNQILEYEFVCVGSYVVNASNVRFWNADVKTTITITELGFRLSLPCVKRAGKHSFGEVLNLISNCNPLLYAY